MRWNLTENVEVILIAASATCLICSENTETGKWWCNDQVCACPEVQMFAMRSVIRLYVARMSYIKSSTYITIYIMSSQQMCCPLYSARIIYKLTKHVWC